MSYEPEPEIVPADRAKQGTRGRRTYNVLAMSLALCVVAAVILLVIFWGRIGVS